jgi:hypothetical protein
MRSSKDSYLTFTIQWLDVLDETMKSSEFKNLVWGQDCCRHTYPIHHPEIWLHNLKGPSGKDNVLRPKIHFCGLLFGSWLWSKRSYFSDPDYARPYLYLLDFNSLLITVEYLPVIFQPYVVQHLISSIAQERPDQLQRCYLLAVPLQTPHKLRSLTEVRELRKKLSCWVLPRLALFVN